MLEYWFYPNPGSATYDSPKVLLIFGVCAALIVASFLIARWRKKHGNAVTKKLSRSWASALRWLGIIGIALVIGRVEQIQFFAMRALWLLWGTVFLGYALFQVWYFRKKHYTVVPKEKVNDPRDQYLP